MAEYLIPARGLVWRRSTVAYGILLLSAFFGNIVPPIPGDTVVVFSAYLVGRRPFGYMAGFSCYLCRGHGRLFSHVLFGL